MPSKEKKQPAIKEESTLDNFKHRLKTQPGVFIGTLIILVIIVIAFVFVPVIAPVGPIGDDMVLGYYNRVPITNIPGNYFNTVIRSLQQQFQQPPPGDPFFMFWAHEIWRMAFDETVIHLGILDEMNRAGFRVPEDIVDREVARLPMFQVNGRFSPSLYRSLDNITRMTIWRETHEDIVKRRFAADIAGLRTSSNEGRFIASMASPRRTFDMAVFPLASFPASEAVAFVEANPTPFKTVHLSRISFFALTDRDARQVFELVRDGITTFEDAARNHSHDEFADRGGDMGRRMAHELRAEIGDERTWESIINLPRGQMSELVRTPHGWAFFRAEEAAQPPNLDDIVQQEFFRSHIMQNYRGIAEDWLLAEAERFSQRAGEISFDTAVSESYITRHSFGPVTLNFGDSMLFDTLASAAVPELTNASHNQFFWRLAFTTPLNTISRPLVIRDNVIVLKPLEEITSDEDELQSIERMFGFWMDPNRIDESTEAALRSYFLNNRRLDDRFNDVFWRLWGN